VTRWAARSWRDGEEATDALVIEMTGDLATAINERSSLAV